MPAKDEVQTTPEWPTTCRMPDLSNLQPISPGFAMRRMFMGHGPSDAKAYGYWVNFVRLVEKAVSDHGSAREALREYLARSGEGTVGIGALSRASGHLETCVGTLVRAIEFGRGIRRTPSDKPNPLPERPNVFRDEVYGKVNAARNAAEHLYDDLRKGTIPEGALLMPAPTERGFDVRGIFLSYDDLAAWITELHSLACRVAGFDPTALQTPPG